MDFVWLRVILLNPCYLIVCQHYLIGVVGSLRIERSYLVLQTSAPTTYANYPYKDGSPHFCVSSSQCPVKHSSTISQIPYLYTALKALPSVNYSGFFVFPKCQKTNILSAVNAVVEVERFELPISGSQNQRRRPSWATPR